MPFAICPLRNLSHAHGRVRSHAAEEGELGEEMQGLFIILRQTRVERETRLAREAGALIFLQVHLLGCDLRVRKMNAFDEVLHVVNREREGAGELPFVDEVAEDVARHGQRERLFVFDEARGRMKAQREAVPERMALRFVRESLRELFERGARGPRVFVGRLERRSGHESAVVGLRAVFLLFDGSAHALKKVCFHGGETKPAGFALCNFEALAAGREAALQVGDGIGSRMIGIVQLRDELGMVAFEPAQEGGVENASGVARHGGVLGGGEGEDDGGERRHIG